MAQNWFQKHKTISIIAGIILFLAIIGMCAKATETTPQKYEYKYKIGDTGSIAVDWAPVATEKIYYDELQKAIAAGDSYGMIEMAEQNKVFALNKDDVVLVLDVDGRKIKIRTVMSNISINNGKSGWIPREYLS